MEYTDSLVEEFIEESPTLSWYDQKQKMTDWHNGKRGLNIRACSDDKLKMNYDICVQKGYQTEARQLQIEGQARGLSWANRSLKVLPVLSASDFDYADYSFVKNNSIRDIINNLIYAISCNGSHLGDKLCIIALIYAIIAQLPNYVEIFKNELVRRGNYTKDEIKKVIQKALQDKDLVAKLNEIKSFKEDLHEDIEKHDTLNPKLWDLDTNTLKSEVKDKIMQIVDDFLKGLKNDEIKFNLTDIKLVGSNCSYNYNKDSDLDVHLVMETGSLHCPDNLYPLLYSAYRSLYNGKLDIDFYGIPVEIFVETDDTEQLNEPEEPGAITEARVQTALKSNGIYSVINDTWIKEPVAEDIPEIDKEAFNKEFKIWEDEYYKIIEDSKKLLKESITETANTDVIKARSIIADQIRGEWDADKGYTKAVADLAELDCDTQKAQETMLDIASEEHTHVGELETVYDAFDPHLFDELEDGHNEVEEEQANTDELTTESLAESIEADKITEIENFIEKLYDLRKISIATEGEFGIGNLVFKELRNKGYLDNLKDLKNQLKSKDLSLE